jgi:hypothetical protein
VNVYLRALMVIVLMTMVDIVFAIYVIETAAHRAASAGLYAALIILIGAFVTRAYVDDKRMIVPTAIGAFLGTYLAVTFF